MVQRRKTYDTEKHVACSHIFLFQKSRSRACISQEELFLDISEALSRTPHFPTNWSTFVARQTWLCYCLNHENTSALKPACFASWAFFVLLAKISAFASTTLLFTTTVPTIDTESLSTLAMSAHFRFGFWFTAAKSQVLHLSAMGFVSSRPWFLPIQNGRPTGAPKTSGTVQMEPSQRKK